MFAGSVYGVCNVTAIGPFIRESDDKFSCGCCDPASDVALRDFVSPNLPKVVYNMALEDSERALLSEAERDDKFWVAAAAAGAAGMALGIQNDAWVEAHYLEDYVLCETMKTSIKNSLGF